MLLSNENIRLRALEPEDLDFLYGLENNASDWDSTNTKSPYSKFELKNYIASSPKDIYDKGMLKLIIERISDGALVGIIDLFDFDFHNSRMEVGIIVDTRYRHCGYGYQALKIVEEYSFKFLKVNQIYSRIPATNRASELLFLKAGYKKTALLPQWIKGEESWIDLIVMQLVNR